MSEDKMSKAEVISKSVEKISDSKGLVAIGDGIGGGLFMFGMALMMAAVFFGSKWDGHLNPQTKCFEIKEINGKTYQLNTCTGEAKELKFDK
ncbi:hypothetical protein [Candidatus Sulfurimonas baltica]|uniref:Uncharacterized protein n=1 Tax=Candidatus Sulfurimonas baltica TaxID=2740404 RepID=A0A7S7RLI8_9BACT|nr:hypothetical protein [Candidatus Sulfurimonas baltica]QOY51192.1 hypothetical protein HUE88_08610 [Candidatus Sulfurimonas baltica]